MNSQSLRSKTGDTCFMFKGEVYSPEHYKPKGRIQLLDRDLYSAMEEWLKEKKEFDKEVHLVYGFLVCLSLNARSWEEIESALPESLHGAIPKDDFTWCNKEDKSTVDFLASCQKEIQLIKQRLLLNLLT